MQQSRWLPSVVMGALLPTRRNRALYSACKGDSPLQCRGTHSAPFGRSESPSISRPLLIQHQSGLSPPGAAGPAAPFGRSVTLSVFELRCARWRTGLSLPVQQSRWPLRTLCGSPLPSSNRALYSAQGGLSPSGAAEPQLPSDAVRSLHQSHLFAYSASDGLSPPVQQPRGSLRSQCDPPSVISSCVALGGGRGSRSRCSRAGPLRRCKSPPRGIKPRLIFSRKGGLSLPVQQSRKLPSDAVRVPPTVASLCIFSIGRGSPSGAADPRLPSVAG